MPITLDTHTLRRTALFRFTPLRYAFTSAIPPPAAAGSMQHVRPAIPAYSNEKPSKEKKPFEKSPSAVNACRIWNFDLLRKYVQICTTAPMQAMSNPVRITSAHFKAVVRLELVHQLSRSNNNIIIIERIWE